MGSILSSFNRQFALIDVRSRDLLATIDDENLYKKPREIPGLSGPSSCGECILRSAAMVERTFGGITTRLWDDPFEWTLPEKLSNKTAVLGYLDEVETKRTEGFGFFSSDDELTREIPAPKRLRPIADILLDALTTASHYQGRAFAIFHVLTAERPPRV